MQTRNISRYVFAVVLIGLGIMGLVKGDFAPGVAPVPESLPGRLALAYLCAVVCLACGGGLLFRRTAVLAARVLFGWMLLWLVVLRLPWMFLEFSVGTWWAASSTAILTGTAWVLYISLANDRDRQRFGFLTGEAGLQIARMLFGLGLIPIGLAHFLYLDNTAPFVPAWLPWHVFWAYFTGGAFIAAGLAMITGVFARLAATLVIAEIGLLTLLVWVPGAIAATLTPFQWGEFVVSILLTACAWVLADSYRDASWLALGRNWNREPV